MRMTRILLGTMIATVTLGCVNGGPDDSGTGGTGGSGGSGLVCEQACQDDRIASGLVSTLLFLYNQNLAGKPVGTQDLENDCPSGGTVHITGQNSVDESTDINTIDFTYLLSDCMYVQQEHEVAFTGTVQRKGTFRSSGYSAITSSGDSVEYSGTVSSQAPTEVSGVCQVSLSENGDDSGNTSVSGQLCGRSVSF